MGRSKTWLKVAEKLTPLGIVWKKLARLPLLDRILGPLLWNEKNLYVTYIPVAEEIEVPPESVLPLEIIKKLIDQASYRFILNHCLCRSGGNCTDYPREIGCIFLGDAVLEINPQFGRMVEVEEAMAHLELAWNHRLIPSIVHSSWDAFLFGIKSYRKMLAVCFCCDCCCVFRNDMKKGPKAFRDRILRLPGLTVTTRGECAGCGACAEACFVSAIELTPDGPRFSDFCKGCGRCAQACPQGNIRVSLDPEANTMEALLVRIGARTDITGSDSVKSAGAGE